MCRPDENQKMIEAIDYRNAMSLLTGAVNVVTTTGPMGRYGFTASAVCSVTDSPATLLVCMNRSSYSHAQFIANKILAVNVLGAKHEAISTVFSSKLSAQERFGCGVWTTLATGAPILEDALVCFDCEIVQVQEVGTHDILIGRVVAIKPAQPHNREPALVYFNRAYHPVGAEKVS
jgi:flavin reductase